MKILVVAATFPEVEPLTTYFKLTPSNFMQHKKFDVLITGVGMTATAFSLGKHLNEGYTSLLNLGIAGAFDRSIAIGTVVNVVEDVFSEFGAQDHDAFLPADTLGLGDTTYYGEAIENMRQARAITVNKGHGAREQIAATLARLQPEMESMEGAAVFFCCKQLAIPCFQVRSISNFVEPRNRDNWNIPLAIATLNHWAIDHLQQITI